VSAAPSPSPITGVTAGFPIGLVFRPGEQLRLAISARNKLGGIFPGDAFDDGRTAGQITVHTGGSQASYLTLPVLPT
jgi:predicted acyl esterase